MSARNVMYAAFEDELSKLASVKGLALVGLGAGGAYGASEIQKMHRLASKEQREQNLEMAKRRLARMQAITDVENRFMTGA